MMVEQAISPRHSRLARTRTFRGSALHRWLEARLFVFGAGNVGHRFAVECLLSGVRSLTVCDFSRTKHENLATQFGCCGERKVDAIVNWARASGRGDVKGLFCDARHVGIGDIAGSDVLIDCTDDPRLAAPLTSISNGLGIPLLRPALDGSGESEMGRVACSHGGGGYSCQLCTYELRDLLRNTRRTPCVPHDRSNRQPTLAGGAIGAAISGLALLQAQKLVTGNEAEKVLDHEWIVDLGSGQLLVLHRRRSTGCLSGHVRWRLLPLPCCAADTTWTDLFAKIRDRLRATDFTLEPYLHALCLEAVCSCGARRQAVGTRWMPSPRCEDCGQPMEWALESCRHRISAEDIARLQLGDETLTESGMPGSGAMFVARLPGRPPQRFVLTSSMNALNSQRSKT